MIDVIKSSKLYFFLDVVIWFIAHNLPIVIGLLIQTYFDGNNTIFIACCVCGLVLIRIVCILIGAKVDITAQHKWANFMYKKAYAALEQSEIEAKQGEFMNALNEDVNEIVGTISYMIDTACNLIYGIIVIVILVLVGLCFFYNSKIGKRVRIRASGTANEAIQKDASTPEGAKAYYNAAIEKKEDELQQENVRYQQMLGKISNYEDDLFHLKKDAMKADVNVNACVDRGDDEAAKVYLKEQQELNDKIDFIKNTLKEWKENADVQKEKVEVLQQQLNDLKAEKESAVLTLETAQASKAFNVTPGVSSSEEEKMLEKVRDGVKKQKEAADGARIVYESSTIVQKQRLDKKMKDDEINKKLQELKAKKGK